jgi:hypothetical protein
MIFTFDDYTVRPVDERDREYIVAILEKDEYHRKMSAEEFFNLVQGEEAFACEDGNGHVLLYMKTQTACRLSMLFAEEDRTRNQTVLEKGLAWLMGALQRNRCRELLFDTANPALAIFARRRLGFEQKPETLSQLIPQPDAEGCVRGLWEDRKKPVGKEGLAYVRRSD